jgi:hypothetical protein
LGFTKGAVTINLNQRIAERMNTQFQNREDADHEIDELPCWTDEKAMTIMRIGVITGLHKSRIKPVRPAAVAIKNVAYIFLGRQTVDTCLKAVQCVLIHACAPLPQLGIQALVLLWKEPGIN